MMRIIFLALIVLISGCSDPKYSGFPEFEEYEDLISEYHDEYNQVHTYFAEDSYLFKIWSIGENGRFYKRTEKGLEVVGNTENAKYRKLLPMNSNIMYMNLESGTKIGIGRSSDCGKWLCEVSAVRYRSESKPEPCSLDQDWSPDLVCRVPLYDGWDLVYWVFDLKAIGESYNKSKLAESQKTASGV